MDQYIFLENYYNNDNFLNESLFSFSANDSITNFKNKINSLENFVSNKLKEQKIDISKTMKKMKSVISDINSDIEQNDISNPNEFVKKYTSQINKKSENKGVTTSVFILLAILCWISRNQLRHMHGGDIKNKLIPVISVFVVAIFLQYLKNKYLNKIIG